MKVPLSLVCALLVPGSLMAGQAPAEQPPDAVPRAIQPAESRFQFYGFIRQDIIFDDSQPDAFQTPLFILPEPSGRAHLSNFTMHPRLTRLGIDFSGPAVEGMAGGRITGRFELDFQNGGRESRAIPRFRHMFMNVAWRGTALLIGQTTDVISPLFPSVNADTLMWNAGNLGDRRPQVRFVVQPPADSWQWSLTTAAGLTGAVDSQDLDNDGVRDGEAAGRPNLQGRVGLSYPIAGTRRLALGVWGHVAELGVSTPIAGKTSFSSNSAGFDVEVPVLQCGVVRGEVWRGRALGDVRGGIAQTVNRSTGDEIRSKGGWIEAGGNLHARYALFVGYTVDVPRRDQVPAGGRTRNGAWFLVNRWNAGRLFLLGVDYLRWTTEYAGALTGTDNRVNIYVVYNF